MAIADGVETIAHLALHFLVPGLVAWGWYRETWRIAFLILSATILVDIDHLLATPIYDPGRCSIGFHPLHTWIPMLIYLAFCVVPPLRLVGIGLVIHMLLDALDCGFTQGVF